VFAALFGTRAIGQGKYVGFLKRVRNTAFARNDTWLYSSLCVVLVAAVLVLARLRVTRIGPSYRIDDDGTTKR
jgi:hypothetical protein